MVFLFSSFSVVVVVVVDILFFILRRDDVFDFYAFAFAAAFAHDETVLGVADAFAPDVVFAFA